MGISETLTPRRAIAAGRSGLCILMVAVLAVVLALNGCYWQSPDAHGDLAVDVSIARHRSLAAASAGALQTEDEEFGVLFLVVFDTRYLDDPQALDDVIGGLIEESLSEFLDDYYEDWEGWDEEPILTSFSLRPQQLNGDDEPTEEDISTSPLYQSARVVLVDIGSAREGSGSIVFSGLAADREYILFGGSFGFYYNAETEMEADVASVGIQAARVRAGSTTQVNLALNKDTGQLERFLFDNYGFSDVYPVRAYGWVDDVDIGGAALEYRGLTADGLYRYHVYLFEQGAIFDGTAIYNQNISGAGRLDPNDANFIEFVVASQTPGFAAGNTYQLGTSSGQRILLARANNLTEGGTFSATSGFLSYTATGYPGEFELDFELTLATDGPDLTISPDEGPIWIDTNWSYDPDYGNR